MEGEDAALRTAVGSTRSLVGAVGAEGVLPSGHEALVGQVEATLPAVEAVLVPGGALVVHHVHALAET